jgi:cytochrome c556
MFKPISAALLIGVLTALATAGAGAAQSPDVATFMKTRHHHFHDIGSAFKGVMDELKKPDPSIAEIQKFAAVIDGLAPQVPSWFPAGTGPETGIKTQALATVWQKPDEFKKDAAAFTTQAHAFNTAALTGKLDAVRAGARPLGETCKTCHETFRARDEH